MIENAFLSLGRLAELVGDPEFLRREGGRNAAIAFGVVSDKLGKWCEALERWGLFETPEAASLAEIAPEALRISDERA